MISSHIHHKVMTNKNIIKDGKKVIDIEIRGIKKLYKSIDSNFEKAVKKLSKVKLDEILLRQNREPLAKACIQFLQHRVALDLAGFENDIFSHSS